MNKKNPRRRKNLAADLLKEFRLKLDLAAADGRSEDGEVVSHFLSSLRQGADRILKPQPHGRHEEIRIKNFMKKSPLEKVFDYLDREDDNLAGFLFTAHTLTATQIPADRHWEYQVVSVAALNLLAALLYACIEEITSLGQEEAERLADAHSKRSRPVDKERNEILKWVHRRRLSNSTEPWKQVFAAAKVEFGKSGSPFPWKTHTLLEQALSRWKNTQGLQSSKRGRPRKTN